MLILGHSRRPFSLWSTATFHRALEETGYQGGRTKWERRFFTSPWTGRRQKDRKKPSRKLLEMSVTSDLLLASPPSYRFQHLPKEYHKPKQIFTTGAVGGTLCILSSLLSYIGFLSVSLYFPQNYLMYLKIQHTLYIIVFRVLLDLFSFSRSWSA